MTILLPEPLNALRHRHLFAMRLMVDALEAPGGPSGMERRISTISGGVIAGDRVNGHVTPGGVDWQIARSDGAVELDARIQLKLDGDALVAMTYAGMRHGPADVLARLGLGEEVSPADYYLRIVARFSTSAPSLEWLNRTMAIGIGHRLPQGPVYNLFEVL